MNENLTIALDPSSGISLQAQIRQSIVELILNHSILPGDKLPSSRMLSQQLKVSRNTVIFAYQALVDTGYYSRANVLVMLSVTMRQRHGLLIRQVPSILTINWVMINWAIISTLRDKMIP